MLTKATFLKNSHADAAAARAGIRACRGLRLRGACGMGSSAVGLIGGEFAQRWAGSAEGTQPSDQSQLKV